MMKAFNKWKVLLAFTALYIVWGSTYLAILIGLESMPPLVMSGMRFLIAGSILFAWCRFKRESLSSWDSISKNAICGILMLFGGTVSVTWAEQYIPSSLAAIIVTSLPFWFVLLDKKQWSFYFSSGMIITGLLLGFAGVILLVGFQHPTHAKNVTTGQQIAGSLVIIGGGIAWTIGSLFSKYRPAGNSLVMNGAIQLLASGLFTVLVSLVTGEATNFSFSHVTVRSWLALSYLVTMGSIITYMSYLFLLKVRPAAQVATYVYVNPVVAILLGTFIVPEPITFLQIIALTIILGGVLLVNMQRFKGARQQSVKQDEKRVGIFS